ncbi:Mechanosensitive ion channel [Mesonia phycicola]|uniref:Mechanosensitive ion channel n=1 Tax=Mesonia phycicola TaxID=579105 RepID=A0A1M6BWH2_9FLAO|nr:mechanosensitive ion channel domain-containing protein [Mesonia phycicola]SHI53136.1 Mechanosensitive ion channel [Mesonia phycicola]
MQEVFTSFEKEIIYTITALILLFIFKFILTTTANKVGKRADINLARVKLIVRYINFLVIFIAIFVLLIVWGVEITQVTVVFSSVFAVIGVGLFAVWSILSNITSGVIMFFSCPYKIGDEIKIHDKDFPFTAIIEDIKAFQIHLRTSEGELITYPNNLILQKAVSLVKKDAFIDSSDEGKDAL